jgi:hypothetical protein
MRRAGLDRRLGVEVYSGGRADVIRLAKRLRELK